MREGLPFLLLVLSIVLAMLLCFSCGTGGVGSPEVAEPTHLGYGVYRFDCRDEEWVQSFVEFVFTHPELKISAIYSATEGGHGWTKSVLVVTEGESPSGGMELEGLEFVEPIHLGNGVYRFDTRDELWVRSFVKFVGDNPDLRVTAIYSATEGGHGWTKSVLVVTEKR